MQLNIEFLIDDPCVTFPMNLDSVFLNIIFLGYFQNCKSSILLIVSRERENTTEKA